MSDLTKYDVNSVHALVVVSAKEHGKVYELKQGELVALSYTEEHPPTYSDDEGFFTYSGQNQQHASGSVKEEDDERNLERYAKAITSELRDWVDDRKPEAVFVIEPEHLKGTVRTHLETVHNTPVEEVAYGNYVEESPETIQKLVSDALTESKDPADPESVAGEENAEEKRKILEVGQKVEGS